MCSGLLMLFSVSTTLKPYIFIMTLENLMSTLFFHAKNLFFTKININLIIFYFLRLVFLLSDTSL